MNRDLDQGGANPLTPQVGFDKQPVELEMAFPKQYCGKTDGAAIKLGNEHLTPLDLIKGQMNCVGMGLKVRPIVFVR